MRAKVVKRYIIVFNTVIVILFMSLIGFLYSKLEEDSIIPIVIIVILLLLIAMKFFLIKVIIESNYGIKFKEILDRLILNRKTINIFKRNGK